MINRISLCFQVPQHFRPFFLAVSSQICQPCQPNHNLRFQGFPVTAPSFSDSRIPNRSNLPLAFIRYQQLYSLSGLCRPCSGNPCPVANQSLRCANCRKLIKSLLLETRYQNIYTHIKKYSVSCTALSPPLSWPEMATIKFCI